MKRTIVLLGALLLIPALATAVVVNPEGFEGYAATGDWNPTQEGEGWVCFGEKGSPAEGNSVKIIAGSGGNSTKVLRINSSANGENLVSEWYQTISNADGDVTRNTFDWRWMGNYGAAEFRACFSRFNATTSYNTWNVEVDARGRAHEIKFLTGTSNDGNSKLNSTVVPGGTDFKKGKWYTLEVEEDNVRHKTRVRHNLHGSTENPWSDWIDHEPTDAKGMQYSSGGKIRVFANGIAEFDNFSMTSEPSRAIRPRAIRNVRNVFEMADGVSNPEGFEGYAATRTWNPTVEGEGWVRHGEKGDPTPGNSVEIVEDSDSNSTKVLRINSSVVAENLESGWYQSIPDADCDGTTTTLDWRWTGSFGATEFRSSFSRFNSELSYYTWSVTVDSQGAVHEILFNTATYNGGLEKYNSTVVPGGTNFEPAKWYTLEIEEDNALHKTRVRHNLLGSTANPWSDWIDHEPTDAQGMQYSSGGKVRVFVNGIAEFDNFSMTSEPSGFIQEVRKVFAMLDEGKGSEVLGYTDKVAGELDDYIEKLRWEARDKPIIRASDIEGENKKAIAALARKQRAIKNGLMQRRILDIVKYQILLKTGELTREEWKAKTCAELNTAPEDSGRIIQYFLWLADKRVTTEAVWDLLKSEVPINAKEELANCLLDKGTFDEEATYKECQAFFWELLLSVL